MGEQGLSALTPADTAQLRVDLVTWARSLRAELTKQLPGSMLTWTTDNNATHANATVYDMARLAEHLDLVMPMEYCNSGDVAMPNLHPHTHTIMYSSRANAAIYDIPLTVSSYAKFGILPDKMAIILPWFGSDFRCAGSGDNCSHVDWVTQNTTVWGSVNHAPHITSPLNAGGARDVL